MAVLINFTKLAFDKRFKNKVLEYYIEWKYDNYT